MLNLLDLTATGEVLLRFGVAYINIVNVTPPILPFDDHYHNLASLPRGNGRQKPGRMPVAHAQYVARSTTTCLGECDIQTHMIGINIAMADFPLAHRLSSIEGELHYQN